MNSPMQTAAQAATDLAGKLAALEPLKAQADADSAAADASAAKEEAAKKEVDAAVAALASALQSSGVTKPAAAA